MGKSPEVTRQLTETESSKFAGAPPKSKGAILGGAVGEFYRDGIWKSIRKIKTEISHVVEAQF